MMKKKLSNKYAILSCQKKLIEKHYNFLKCEIDWRRNILVCEGAVTPHYMIEDYKVRIEYAAGKEPKSTILAPKITPTREIHMYNDHSLCLHYPNDLIWNEKIPIYRYTIPWISEWILFYEIYKRNGNKWEGRESPSHITEADKNVNYDY